MVGCFDSITRPTKIYLEKLWLSSTFMSIILGYINELQSMKKPFNKTKLTSVQTKLLCSKHPPSFCKFQIVFGE